MNNTKFRNRGVSILIKKFLYIFLEGILLVSKYVVDAHWLFWMDKRANHSPFMLDDFLRRITKLKCSIEKLGSYTDKSIELYNRKLRDILNADEEREVSQQISLVADLFRKQSREIKNELESISQENSTIKERYREDSLEYQSRNLHWQRCTKNLTAEINRFRQEQLKYAKNEKEKLRSQCMAVNPGATEKEISKILASENSDAVLQKILAGGSESSKARLEEVKNKNTKIKSLTRKLDELLEMINDLQKMVNRTGKTVDKIEVKMERTKVSTEAAKQDLQAAYRYQVRAMWIKRILFGVILAVIILIITYLAIRFIPGLLAKDKSENKDENGNGNNNKNK